MQFLTNNNFLFLAEIVLTFSFIVLLYYFMGLEGLFLWIPLSIFISNVTVIKQVDLFGFHATLGNVTYASTFLVTDLLGEHYSKSHAQKSVWIGFISFILVIVFTQLSLLYQPNEFDQSQSALKSIFSTTPSLLLSSLMAFLVSQTHDVWAFDLWKRILPSRKLLWWRNNASTLVSQFLDTLVFVGLATILGIFPKEIFSDIFLSTYILKVFINLCDTPFLYWLSHLHRKKINLQN